jgi:hypothetical protein
MTIVIDAPALLDQSLGGGVRVRLLPVDQWHNSV